MNVFKRFAGIVNTLYKKTTTTIYLNEKIEYGNPIPDTDYIKYSERTGLKYYYNNYDEELTDETDIKSRLVYYTITDNNNKLMFILSSSIAKNFENYNEIVTMMHEIKETL